MLIYAQRPDAKACATMEIWNEKMFCWVNRGATRKDNVVTFEQLGVDRLFVDESHNYKNRVKRCRIRQD